MFSFLKKGMAGLAALALALALASFQAPAPASWQPCTCNAPANGSATPLGSGEVLLSWDTVAGASGYQAWYVRQADSYTGPAQSTTNTGTSFTGLAAGRYTFHISTLCGGTFSEGLILEDIILE